MADSRKIQVLIVDDIQESRDNVAKLLRFEPDVMIVGSADGGEEAIELALRYRPDVILMDVTMPGMDGIAASAQITSLLPNAAIVMMSVQNEPDQMRRAMMTGAREFLAKPFSLDELVESIRRAYEFARANRRVTGARETQEPITTRVRGARKARVISVFSLKGGVGRSTIAANLAVAIRHQFPDKDVALIDGNFLHGDIGVIFNAPSNKTIADIVRNFQALDRDLITDILVTHSSGVKVLLAPPDVRSGELVAPEHVTRLVRHLQTMVDVIVIDTRPSFDETTLALLDQSDRILLMLTLELTAIKGAKQYLELSDLLGYSRDKIALVLNRSTAPAGIPVADVGASLKGEIIAKLPDDPLLVLRAINQGVPFMQSAPSSPLAHEIAKLAANVMGDGAEVPKVLAEVVNGRRSSRWIPPMARKRAG